MKSSLGLLAQRRFLPLFVTQFLNAFNDSFYRTAIVILAIYTIYSDATKEAQFSTIAQALFILPFFVLSAVSGQLADSHDKARIVRIVKTAEIGIMRITEQIDALDTMAVNPLQYLIAPKLMAGLIGVPLLVAIFDVVGIYGGYLVGVDLLGVNAGSYWTSIESSVEWKDVYGGILKSISFGLIISWVCCYKGFYTRMSAEGLGSATTEAVVLSSVVILVWDYFLTSVLL